MALTVDVSKTSIRLVMPKMWSASLSLRLTDDDGPGFERTFAENYKAGKSLTDLADAFREKMQAAIDQYKAERTLFNKPQFDAVATAVQNGLEV